MLSLLIFKKNSINSRVKKLIQKIRGFFYLSQSSKFNIESSSSSLNLGLKFVKFEVRKCQSSGVRSSNILSSFHH